MNNKMYVAVVGVALSFFGTIAAADPIGCGTVARYATLDSASACQTAVTTGSSSNNATASDILASFAGDSWGKLSDVSVIFTRGRFDANRVSLDWTLPADIWSTWNEIVISIHVGGGNGSPSWFAWLITPQTTSGTLVYDRNSGGGGGFSNIKSWGRGEPTTTTQVPEPGSLALLGLGLAGLGLSRRRRTS